MGRTACLFLRVTWSGRALGLVSGESLEGCCINSINHLVSESQTDVQHCHPSRQGKLQYMMRQAIKGLY